MTTFTGPEQRQVCDLVRTRLKSAQECWDRFGTHVRNTEAGCFVARIVVNDV